MTPFDWRIRFSESGSQPHEHNAELVSGESLPTQIGIVNISLRVFSLTRVKWGELLRLMRIAAARCKLQPLPGGSIRDNQGLARRALITKYKKANGVG